MSNLKSPASENILLAAFRTLDRKNAASPEDLVDNYEQFFKSSVVVPLGKSHIFERLSLVDSNIQLSIQSHT